VGFAGLACANFGALFMAGGNRAWACLALFLAEYLLGAYDVAWMAIPVCCLSDFPARNAAALLSPCWLARSLCSASCLTLLLCVHVPLQRPAFR
jgi:hypothetical protein